MALSFTFSFTLEGLLWAFVNIKSRSWNIKRRNIRGQSSVSIEMRTADVERVLSPRTMNNKMKNNEKKKKTLFRLVDKIPARAGFCGQGRDPIKSTEGKLLKLKKTCGSC